MKIHMKYKATLFLTFCFIFTIFIKDIHASSYQDIVNYMNSLNTLPEFCQYRLAETKFRKDFTDNQGQKRWPKEYGSRRYRWESLLGKKNWTYIHHYCFGIRAIMDYSMMSTQNKKKYKKRQMERALSEFQFMKNAQTYNFPLWYDLYNYEAYVYMRLDQPQKAEESLRKALGYKLRSSK